MSVRPQVVFDSPTDTLRILMGDGTPKITDGYGGWEVIDRPHRVGATWWPGKKPFQMEVPLIFDGWDVDDSVEGVIRRFENMALPAHEHEPPPVLKVTGPIPWGGGNEWVVTNLVWGDAVRRRSDGDRVRQPVVVTLLRFNPVVRVGQGAAARARSKGKTKSSGSTKSKHGRVYVVKKGDTLSGIAARELGDASRWREIARLNNIRDPKSIHPGQRLRMP